MIRCNMCGDLEEVGEMYFVSLLPHFTYLDSVLCKTCVLQLQDLITAGKTIEFEWEDMDKNGKPVCGFYWSEYNEILFFITLRGFEYGIDEIICPDCGGLAIWDLEELGEDKNGELEFGDEIWTCLNCAWRGYVI